MVPKLEGVDELLHLPLDEDCLQKLLSGADLEEDLHAAVPKVHPRHLHVKCMLHVSGQACKRGCCVHACMRRLTASLAF